MKKLLFSLFLGLIVVSLRAQESSDSHIFVGGTVLQEVPMGTNQVHLQVGSAIHYKSTDLGDGSTASIRFPWDVLYIPLTFDDDQFEVSKGFFSDKIRIDWLLQANDDRIDQIRIYRRLFDERYTDDEEDYQLIATVSSDISRYEDTDIQGGVLYEYKVEAIGLSSIPEHLVTYITDIRYRNPTAVVMGNISFDGGSPVKDVVVRADPQGAQVEIGSSLALSGSGLVDIQFREKAINENATLQAWVKLNEGTSGTLFKLADRVRTTEELVVSYQTTENDLEISVTHDTEGTRTFSIGDYYPSGNVDGSGADILLPFSSAATPQQDFASNFVQLTIVLENGEAPRCYLNGREVTESYIDTLPEEGTTTPTISTSGTYVFSGFETAEIAMAHGLTGYFDEVRIWNIALTDRVIRTDFKRYLSGGETGLISYLRLNENAGAFGYDLSKVGFEFNKNHGRVTNAIWSSERPTASQLGISGVTDQLGNYIISAIPYAGTGESYTITPLLGVHQFEPAQQLAFVGVGSEVLNKIDFKDISSFDFLGVAQYTTDGVFDPVEAVDNVTFVEEAGYNQYRAIIDGNEQLISKGRYFYDDQTDPENPVLYETPNLYVPGANIYIDGSIVLDEDNRPVVTDEEGFFKISVPIGNHFIEVRKDKHHFTHDGRFPAEREDGDDLFEFFEHQQSAVTFLDTTRVSLVGRVVGGTIEADKPIGFGFDGALQETYEIDSITTETVDISSVNNIGQATITLSHLPFGGTPGIGELEYTLTTNQETGEYKAELLPISYSIDQATGIRINNNSSIQLLDANETVNLSSVPDLSTDEYTDSDSSQVISEPYHFEKSFTCRSTPVLTVVSQIPELQVDVGDGNTVSTEGFEYPIYLQGRDYAIGLVTFEEYINYDNGQDTARVPSVDGEFIITNNLALGDYEKVENTDLEGFSIYYFKAGLPAISAPFTSSINIMYRVNGQDYEARSYNPEGIIIGGRSDGSQTFVTEAPDTPDIILRDPPGSNSFASIDKGESISINETTSVAIGQTANVGIEMKMGALFVVGGGLAGPVVESKTENSIEAGLSLAVSSVDGESITKTYTFNKTISTSSSPKFVGSDADLYIGNTTNYRYGVFDNVQIDKQPIGSTASLEMINNDGDTIYISKQKALSFTEEPTETFFVYSQNHILNTLIPDLETIIEAIDNGTIIEGEDGALTKSQYEEQIRLWKKTIQDNERTKYLALNEREDYKARIATNLEDEVDISVNHINAIGGIGGAGSLGVLTGLGFAAGATKVGLASLSTGATLSAMVYVPVALQGLVSAEEISSATREALEERQTFVEEGFEQNISFDAGVGSFTQTTKTNIAQQTTRKVNLTIEPSVKAEFGFTFNETGFIRKTNYKLNASINSSLAVNNAASTTVKYTLMDNDMDNFLSVDVVNAFDGNGPIFSTIGGQTSCPYEGVDTTLFYNHSEFLVSEENEEEDQGEVFSGGEQISFATLQIEDPAISVEVASVSDVPEERSAEFNLILENNSSSEVNGYYKLFVDNTTNPNNAIINIAANGTVVYVPYGVKTEYALTLDKSISDVYNYENINIVIQSLCDTLINDRVTISARFQPSCTSVEIDGPLQNWVFNSGDAFNSDNSTNPLNISMFGYDRSFGGFETFRLEYRRSTSSSWTRLQTYYNSQELLDAAILEGEDQGSLIVENTSNFSWDIGAQGLADGEYELRVVSTCANGTTFISEPISGMVDLNQPSQFGTPSPTDGILGAGEDLLVQFNEDIVYSSALSKIEIKGETNQQEINHNVSVRFDGADNTITLEKPLIPAGDFAIELLVSG